ncbi:hypothetical protein HC928_04995 [bacterium]|nr:hypothetical protein [bacterium]
MNELNAVYKQVHDACFAIGQADVVADIAFLKAFVQAYVDAKTQGENLLHEALEGYFRTTVLQSKEAETAQMYIKRAASVFNILGRTNGTEGEKFYVVDAKGGELQRPDENASAVVQAKFAAAEGAIGAFGARFRRVALVAKRAADKDAISISSKGELEIKNLMFMTHKEEQAKPKMAESWTDINRAAGRSIRKMSTAADEYYKVTKQTRNTSTKAGSVKSAVKLAAETFSKPGAALVQYEASVEADSLLLFVSLAIKFGALNPSDKDGTVSADAAGPVLLACYAKATALKAGAKPEDVMPKDDEDEDDGDEDEDEVAA